MAFTNTGTLSGSGPFNSDLINNGLIDVSGGDREIGGTLSSTLAGGGSIAIEAGGTLQLDKTSSGNNVTFNAGHGTLMIEQLGSIASSFDIVSINSADVIVLPNVPNGFALSYDTKSGTLAITSGTTTLGDLVFTPAASLTTAFFQNIVSNTIVPTPAWTGSSGTDLGTAANWQPASVPNAGQTAQFNLAAGGTLTGTLSALNATFGSAGPWFLQAATLSLAGEGTGPGTALALTDQGDVTVSGGSIAAAGSLAIETFSGAVMDVLGTAHVGFQGLAVGSDSEQTGTLAVNGAGTTIQNNGSNGVSSIGGAGQGVVDITGGATISNAAGATLGVSNGGFGTLAVSDSGSKFISTGEIDVGASGLGHLSVANQATVQSGGNASAPSQGFAAGQLAGGDGDVTVSGTKSLLTNTGRFVVGDAGVGGLSVTSGATVVTSPGTVAGLAGAVIGNAAGSGGSTVNVIGAGSGWQVGGLLDVGVSGSASLLIDGGATVTAAALDGGISAAAVAQIGISGAGSRLSITNGATVADDGTGVLSVLSGATFAASSLTIGSQGDSSGAVVVSGAGSLINLSGALNVGTALGVGDLTIGPGATVNAGVVSLNGDVVLEGGELDPSVNLINPGNTLSGSGVIANNVIVDEGLLLANGQKVSQRLLTITGTIVGGGTLTVNGTVTASGSPGIVQINASDTIDLTGPVLNAATTTFTDNQTPTGTYTVNNSVIDVVFADGTGVLLLDDIAGFGGTISTFKTGDAFVIGGGTLSNLGVTNGDTLTFSDSGTKAAQGGVDSLIFGAGVTASRFNIVNGNTVQAVACFAEGTRIETEHGPVAVENLSVGDAVVAADGRMEAIIWIGRREIHCARHSRPETVWPVLVSAGAFGDNVPARDLYLSPDHAVFVNDVLVPVKLLVNGTSIVQVRRETIVYYHVELPRHDVILAEDLPVESYLDAGDRLDVSDNLASRLFPGFPSWQREANAMAWEVSGGAPLVLSGPVLAAVRTGLREHAAAFPECSG